MKTKIRDIVVGGVSYVWMVKNKDHNRYLTVWTDKQNKVIDEFKIEEKIVYVTPRLVKDIIECFIKNNNSFPKIIEYSTTWENVNKYELFENLALGVKFKYSYCSQDIYVKISHDTIARWYSDSLSNKRDLQKVFCFTDGNDGASKSVWLIEQ
jgi:hypothetical protein